jgi:hypothetical protein
VEVLPVDGYHGIIIGLVFGWAPPLGNLPRGTEFPHDPLAKLKYPSLLI